MEKRMDKRFDPITLGILWDRLISITDQVVATLVKTSFSTIVRESYDLSCVLFDANGQSLAQGSYSAPSFTSTAPQTVRHMLDKYPPEALQPGDVVITNDPWMGTGHLFDVNVLRPVFRGTKLVGYTFSITHLPDIGGLGWSIISTEVYEEGLRLPICKLVKAGQLNEELIDLIRINVRTPDMTIGALMANVSCTEVGGRLLLEFMDEYGIDDLAPLSDAIISQSENAMREKIREMPDGQYSYELKVDGVADDITIVCQVTVSGDSIHVDFDGTGPSIRLGVNTPFCYTHGMACYTIKCLTTANIPNNEGSFRPITVSAPEGCILNTMSPSPTAGRHIHGHFVTPAIFGALSQMKNVPAEPGMIMSMPGFGTRRDGRRFSSIYFGAGGLGALDNQDGTATTPAPTNMKKVPHEVWEDFTDISVISESFLCDSGGAGKFRGGVGVEIVMRNDSGHLMTFDFFACRTRIPARGINGGKSGALRQLFINGEETQMGLRIGINPGDEIMVREAGGGGYGNPRERPVEKVLDDFKHGFVSIDGALQEYGVRIDLERLTAERI
jgi:N-methylhydantoinase B